MCTFRRQFCRLLFSAHRVRPYHSPFQSNSPPVVGFMLVRRTLGQVSSHHFGISAPISFPRKLHVNMRLAYPFCILPYDRSTASSEAGSPHSAIQYFLFQVSVYSPFLKVVQQLRTSSFSSSSHFYPSPYLPFNNIFQEAVPTQVVTNPVSLPSFQCVQDIPVLLYVILLNFSHDRSN